jgi:hypothetical protein
MKDVHALGTADGVFLECAKKTVVFRREIGHSEATTGAVSGRRAAAGKKKNSGEKSGISLLPAAS